MKKIIICLIILISINYLQIFSQSHPDWYPIIGSSYIENKSYKLLERLCDEAGGRLVGSEVNEKALSILKEELEKLNINSKFETFKIPGWVRENDEITMIAPTFRKLKTIALGYVEKTNIIESNLIYAGHGYNEDYDSINVKDKIVIITQGGVPNKEEMLRYEAIEIAAKHGAKALLFINDKIGLVLLAGVSNFQGNPSLIPAFSISYEEGMWLERLLNDTIQVKLKINTNSYCKEIETSNVVVTFPGVVQSKIVVGAHFDSWDKGQGAVDNGIGTATLFDLARLFKQFSPNNYFTVEFVWFNGEELGLWGSKKYMEAHKNDDIIAMINMDMTGSPTGFNAMGYDEFIPFFKSLIKDMNGFNLSAGVSSQPYTNSDHISFMFNGIPTFSMQATLDKDMYWYYHDAGDTFDKVSIRYLSDASAIIGILIKELANNRNLPYKKYSKEETKALLLKYNLDKRLKRQKEWIFGD
ncbi:MAG: M28 family peptidase [FCB group bacterium]|jgi:Iap family predicted aminopeptidase